MISLLGVVQSGPQINTPACAPTGGLVALNLQRTLGCLLQGGISEMIAWVETDEVALMAMLEIPVVPVVVPLVQVAHVADSVGVQLSQGLLHLLILQSKHLACSNGVDKQFADNGQIGCTTVAGSAVIALIGLILVLGRCAGGSNQLAWLLGVVDEPTQAELGSTLHQRIGNVLQVSLVLCKLVALPQGVYQPGTTQVPVTPFRTLVLLAYRVGHRPDVAVVTRAPALVDVIVVLGGELTVGCQAGNKTVKWLSHLGHVSHKGWPVVLLQIDVYRIVATPGRPQLGGPQTLQVGRHVLGARG